MNGMLKLLLLLPIRTVVRTKQAYEATSLFDVTLLRTANFPQRAQSSSPTCNLQHQRENLLRPN
jgi:hypothetical protein